MGEESYKHSAASAGLTLYQPLATSDQRGRICRLTASPAQRSSQIVLGMMQTFPIPVFILAFVGLAVTLWKWRELLFIYTMIALTIAQALFFYGSARFHAPIEPMLILLASGTLWWFTSSQEGTLRWLIDRQRKASSPSIDNQRDNAIPV